MELTTMSLIQTNDTCILRTLADAVGVEPPAMNRIVNSLEDKQLASRHKSSKDSRYTFFKLTEAGLECLKYTSAAVDQAERDLLGSLTECERQKLLLYLQRFL
nr:MarR family transcriptional regulator [Ruegeria sp. HKCCD8929]